MKKVTRLLLLIALIIPAELALAEEKDGGRPPALVVLSEVARGESEPMDEFIGTVNYVRVSRVASEVEGRVRDAGFNEGDRVGKGQVLAQLGTELVDTTIETARATFEQAVAERDKAEKDFKRAESLLKEDAVSQVLYDERYLGMVETRKKSEALKASLDRLILQKEKMSIKAPFAGVVVEKQVEVGEWVSPGGKVAVVADDTEVDVIVDVPSSVLGYLKKGRTVNVTAGGERLEARFASVVPKGDVSTRTFAIKLRMKNRSGLIEGMEARAVLPVGPKVSGLLVNRDAIVNVFGRDAVFVVEGSAAKMVPVRVVGYNGLKAGIEALGPPETLKEGMNVVIKGNERLMDGQQVTTGGR